MLVCTQLGDLGRAPPVCGLGGLGCEAVAAPRLTPTPWFPGTSSQQAPAASPSSRCGPPRSMAPSPSPRPMPPSVLTARTEHQASATRRTGVRTSPAEPAPQPAPPDWPAGERLGLVPAETKQLGQGRHPEPLPAARPHPGAALKMEHAQGVWPCSSWDLRGQPSPPTPPTLQPRPAFPQAPPP